MTSIELLAPGMAKQAIESCGASAALWNYNQTQLVFFMPDGRNAAINSDEARVFFDREDYEGLKRVISARIYGLCVAKEGP